MRQTIRDFILENYLYGGAPSALRDDESFLESGIIDSTGVLELVGHIETQYGIRVEADEITPDNLDSLDKLVAFISRKSA